MLIRDQRPEDVGAVRDLTTAAFRDVPHRAPPVDPDGAPGESTLVTRLLDGGWAVPGLSLVAQTRTGRLIGHVVASRAHVDAHPVLGLGPVSVAPLHQGRGVGSSLVRALLRAADDLEEPLVGLLGDPAYYGRFGFVAAGDLGVAAPDPAWGDAFQVRPLAAYAGQTGRFRYAEPFERL